MSARFSIRDFSNALALLGIVVVFAILEPKFVGARNLSLLMTELSITASLALGMLLIILPGHIDLSVGSGVGLLGGVASVLVFQHHLPAPLALVLASVLGVLLWLGMGALIVKERMPAFIITLGGLLIFKGLFWRVINNSTVPVVEGGQTNLYSLLTTYYLPVAAGWVLAVVVIAGMGWSAWSDRKQRQLNGFEVESGEMLFLRLFVMAQIVVLGVIITHQYRGIPLPAVLLGAVALVVQVLTRQTPFGRYLYAIGGNEEAARVSGVPMQKVVIGAFGIMGAIVALTGFMQTAYAGSSTTTVGELMELDAIAACVIGGVSLKGGRGSVMGVLFGALIMACLLNGMTLMAVSPEAKFMARGIVLVLAVWMDVRLGRRG